MIDVRPKSMAFRTFSGVVCLSFILPFLVYCLLNKTIIDFNNNQFRIISLTLFFIAIIGIVFSIIFNVIVSKKIEYVYRDIVSQKKEFDYGVILLKKYSKMVFSRIVFDKVLLYISYTYLRKLDIENGIIWLKEVREYNSKYRIGAMFDYLSTFCLILCYYYIGKTKVMNCEIDYISNLNEMSKVKDNYYLMNCVIKNIHNGDYTSAAIELEKLSKDNDFILEVAKKMTSNTRLFA